MKTLSELTNIHRCQDTGMTLRWIDPEDAQALLDDRTELAQELAAALEREFFRRAVQPTALDSLGWYTVPVGGHFALIAERLVELGVLERHPENAWYRRVQPKPEAKADDAAALKAKLIECEREIADRERRIDDLKGQRANRELDIEAFKQRIATLKHELNARDNLALLDDPQVEELKQQVADRDKQIRELGALTGRAHCATDSLRWYAHARWSGDQRKTVSERCNEIMAILTPEPAPPGKPMQAEAYFDAKTQVKVAAAANEAIIASLKRENEELRERGADRNKRIEALEEQRYRWIERTRDRNQQVEELRERMRKAYDIGDNLYWFVHAHCAGRIREIATKKCSALTELLTPEPVAAKEAVPEPTPTIPRAQRELEHWVEETLDRVAEARGMVNAWRDHAYDHYRLSDHDDIHERCAALLQVLQVERADARKGAG